MRRKISHYQTVVEIAYNITKQHLPRYRHKNSPHRFTWPQLVACVLKTFYLDYSYRDMEDWLLVSDKICGLLDLHEIPDHSTLCRAFHKMDVRLLRALQRLLLQNMRLKEMPIGIDSTDFSTEQASAYYSFRNGRPKKDWVKGAYTVGVMSQFILGTCASYGRYQDSVYSKAYAANLEPIQPENMLYLQMPVSMAGKSNLETLFRPCEGTVRFVPLSELRGRNWWHKLGWTVCMGNVGSVKLCIPLSSANSAIQCAPEPRTFISAKSL